MNRKVYAVGFWLVKKWFSIGFQMRLGNFQRLTGK